MSPNLKLYTAGTPNGQKIHIALEELGLPYEVHKIDISKNEQKEPWFLEINPNGRIPALVDHSTTPPQRLFEGGSILQYLTARYDKSHLISFPYDTPDYWESISWLTWMQSGVGPIQGQANHFYRYAPEKIPYAINRYQTETKRLYSVLEDRLAKEGDWLSGMDATERGLNVPDKFELRDAMRSKEGEEEYARYHSGWVMKGQEKDQETHK